MPAHTVSLVIIEPSDQFSHERLDRLVGSSLPQLARFRSRLVGRPLGVGQPLWAEIDDYDPTSQIHRATIQAPGGQRELAALIAQLSAGSRGHRKNLWEAWSIDGLSDGRWALAVRMSPALSDGGVGAASVWSRLLCSDAHDHRAVVSRRSRACACLLWANSLPMCWPSFSSTSSGVFGSLPRP